MKRLIPLLTSIVLFVPLAGCKDQVPKCSDDDTIALVKNIVAEQLGDGDEVAEVKAQFVIEYARASSFNESIKKYECEAKLISGGTYQLPITYDSQIDDSGQHIVAVGGIGRGDLFQLAAAAVQKIKESKDAAERARAASAPATVAQSPRLGAVPTAQPHQSAPTPPAAEPKAPQTKPLPTSDVPQAVRSFMDKTYGAYNAKHACWQTTYEDQAYCLKPVRMDRITADTGERFYLLVGGSPIDEDGEPMSVHALAGLVGAFVFELREGGNELVASTNAMYAGSSGTIPDQWDLVKLARTGYYGWKTTSGDCHQGYCGTALMLLAPFGKSVKDIAAFNISYEDGGACETQECPNGPSSIDSTVSIDGTASTEIYPLVVTFKGTMSGRDLSGMSRRLEFDRKSWRYAVPEDWPLTGVDY